MHATIIVFNNRSILVMRFNSHINALMHYFEKK